MSVQVRRRRETAAFLATYVGAQGELLVDTTNNRVQVHDGATPGGWPAARLADLPTRSGVRQTVLAGPAASGAPSFLPAATTGTLTLSTQGISPTTPFTATAANGFGALGPNDLVLQYTTNQSWTLPASATSYLALNATTGLVTSFTLQPIYQFGGAIATTVGQFTFDTQAMVGFLGTGTLAVATPLVFVGEAVTSASVVTSATAYAYGGRVFLTQATLAAGTRYPLAHNIGVRDLQASGYLECTASAGDAGYAFGDRVSAANNGNTGSGSAFYGTLFATSGTKTVSIITGTSGIGAVGASGAVAPFTAANWKAGVVVARTW